MSRESRPTAVRSQEGSGPGLEQHVQLIERGARGRTRRHTIGQIGAVSPISCEIRYKGGPQPSSGAPLE